MSNKPTSMKNVLLSIALLWSICVTAQSSRVSPSRGGVCNAPANTFNGTITTNSAAVKWNKVSGASKYRVKILINGTWTYTTRTDTTYIFTGLTAGTTYSWAVQQFKSCQSAYTALKYFTTLSTGGGGQVPQFNKIVLVIGENTKASSVLGNTTDAPYINSLATNGVALYQSYAIEHPSQPNYLDLFSGSNQGVTDDNLPASHFTTANLARELINAGKSYINYSEDLPGVGYDGSSSGLYVRKHNAVANWMGAGTNQVPTTTNQPFTAFPTDFSLLPDVSYVIPNLCSDGHDVCAPYSNRTKQYDAWVQSHLDTYKQWCINNNSLLIVTYDEDDFTSTNRIATVFYGAHTQVGTYNQTVNHFNVLRTIEQAKGLTVHAGAAATATAIDFCWSSLRLAQRLSSVKNNFKVYPNPANASITVEGDGPLTIMDLTGRVNYETSIEGKTIIDVSFLPNGIYFVKLNNDVLRLLKE